MKLRNILWGVLLAVAPFTWAARQDMRIMTFNIRHGGIDVSIGNGQNTWENRALAIHRYVDSVQPDLIGMQETVRTQLMSLLSGMPAYCTVGRGCDNGADEGRVTAIAYRTDRFRALAWDTFWLTDTPSEVSKVEGGINNLTATWAIFEDKLSGVRFGFCNTHLSTVSAAIRNYEIRLIKTRMRDLRQQYGLTNFFLTGDFNMRIYENADGSKAEDFQGENYVLASNLGVSMKDAWSFAPQLYKRSTAIDGVDYIFVTKNVSFDHVQRDPREDADGYFLSDHYPFWADVHFTTSATEDARAAVREAWCEIDSVCDYAYIRTKLLTSADQLSTDGTEPGYPVSNIIDGNTSTFTHSQWKGTARPQPHYVQVELRQPVANVCFTYRRRDTGSAIDGVRDRWQDVMVTASEDGTQWDYVTEFHDFGGDALRTYTSPHFPLRRPCRHLRFHVMHTPGEVLRNNYPQYTCSEFQLYEYILLNSCPRKASPEVCAAADALELLIATTEELIEKGTVKRADVAALQSATQLLREARLSYATAISPPPEKHGSHDNIISIYDPMGRLQPSLQQGVNILRKADDTVCKVLIK